MKALFWLLLGGAIFTAVYSCGSGAKRPDYSDFPVRADEYSVWMQCKDKSKDHVCKYECANYKRDNSCKPEDIREKRKKLADLVEQGWVVLSKPFFLELIDPSK